MKKFIDYIKGHWIYGVITIILAVEGLVKLFKGHFFIFPLIKSSFANCVLFYSEEIKIRRTAIFIPWILVISLSVIAVSHIIRIKKGYEDVSIQFLGNKLIVRFWISKGGSKEYADGRIICGICKILLERAHWGGERCPRCGLGYGPTEVDRIIAEARSKWITGKPQAGYIKTGKK